MTKQTEFHLPPPTLQAEFAVALEHLRGLHLQNALLAVTADIDITVVDRELAELVSAKLLSAVAGRGLRGELLFAVPSILIASPMLLAYYRLLLGYSRKEFYGRSTGISLFQSAETGGRFTTKQKDSLHDLCLALCRSASELLNSVGAERVTRDLLDDLTLLTLGPQLRGGANVQRGSAAIARVFDVIHDMVSQSIVREGSNSKRIHIKNNAGRTVFIEFAADPDIIIRVSLGKNEFRHILAIEVKGGTDFSNIHNRIGEAEKSHQKAKQEGYTECWTVVNVQNFDVAAAKRESPSTDRFYSLSGITDETSQIYEDFRNRILDITGLPQP